VGEGRGRRRGGSRRVGWGRLLRGEPPCRRRQRDGGGGRRIVLGAEGLLATPRCWETPHATCDFGPNLDRVGRRVKRSVGRGGGRGGGGGRGSRRGSDSRGGGGGGGRRLRGLSLENAGGLALQLGVVAPRGGSLGVPLARQPEAGLGWTGQAVGRGSYRRALGEERRVVVGVRRPLGQDR